MRKILFLGFTLFFCLSLILVNNNTTFSYEDCHHQKVIPKEVTTLNLKDYVKNENYELVSFCSFDMCYVKREDDINQTISSFKKLFNKYLSEDDYNELNIKGYPITEIIINAC